MSTDIDLNLARTFVVVYETRNVTVAADLLGVTQPTVSYGLAKLRRRTQDELFTRAPGGLRPTAQADRLYESISAAVSTLDNAFTGRDSFDPTVPTQLSVTMSDLGEVTVLPLILAELADRGPAIDLKVNAFDLATAADQLQRGDTDIVVTSSPLDRSRLSRRGLFTEHYVGVVADGHPRLGVAPSQEELSAERFVVVDGSTGHPGPRAAIGDHGLEDRIAVRVTRFAALPYVVGATELVAIIPDIVAALMSRGQSLRTFTLPWEIAPIEVSAYMRRSPAPHPAQRWLLGVITDACGRIPAG